MTKKKKSKKRELIEWGVFFAVIGIIYVTGWHTEVVGGFQRLLLMTGIHQPNIENPTKEIDAHYAVQLEDLQGNAHSLEDFKRKVIFMNLWATWCPPCVGEMPDIHNLYQSIASEKEIVFVMLSLDEDIEKVKKFIKRKEFQFPVYVLKGGLPPVYNATVIPTTYVISPEGKIALKNEGIAQYNTEKFKNFLLDLKKN